MQKILELLIAVPAIVGTMFVSINETNMELMGWTLYIVSDLVGIYFFAVKKHWILVTQYLVFTAIAINGILQRV